MAAPSCDVALTIPDATDLMYDVTSFSTDSKVGGAVKSLTVPIEAPSARYVLVPIVDLVFGPTGATVAGSLGIAGVCC